MRRRFAALLCILFLGGCADSPRPAFHGTDVSGAGFGRDFRLSDPAGKPYRLSDFHGKVVTLFFGYTQCPDVCPTNLSTMAQVMKRLGPRADRVQVLFVTVDPERDTPQVLAAYVSAFDKRFLGLAADPEATSETAREFRVFYQKRKGAQANAYTVDHSTGTYVYDPRGRLRLLEKHGESVDNIVADIIALMDAP